MESASKLEGALFKAQRVDVKSVLKKIKTECKLHPEIFHKKLQNYRREFAHYRVPRYLQKQLSRFKSMDYFFIFIAWREAYAFMPWEMYLEILAHGNTKKLGSAIESTKKRYGMHYNARGGCIFLAIAAAIVAGVASAASAASAVAATSVGIGTAIASSSVVSAVVGGVASAAIGVATDAVVDAIKK